MSRRAGAAVHARAQTALCEDSTARLARSSAAACRWSWQHMPPHWRRLQSLLRQRGKMLPGHRLEKPLPSIAWRLLLGVCTVLLAGCGFGAMYALAPRPTSACWSSVCNWSCFGDTSPTEAVIVCRRATVHQRAATVRWSPFMRRCRAQLAAQMVPRTRQLLQATLSRVWQWKRQSHRRRPASRHAGKLPGEA